jgi:hypothetical protein
LKRLLESDKMLSNTFNKSMPSTLSQMGSVDDDSNKVLPNWTNPALYKTRFCDHFRTKGECK